MSLGGIYMEIKSTKPLTEEEKKALEKIKKKIEEEAEKIRYDFKNQKNNEKLKDWLMK